MQDKIIYRLRQFLRGLNVHITEDEQGLVREILTPTAQALFRQMPPDAQRHSLNVLYTLQEDGPDVVPDLAAAALLHDVGKVATEKAGIKLTLWLRGPLVLLNFFAPGWKHDLAADVPMPKTLIQRWQYLLYVHFEHPQIGSVWAEDANCSPLTCWLIKHHQTDVQLIDEPHALWKIFLVALQCADGRN